MTPLAWLGILAILLVIEAITVGLTTVWFAGGALVACIASWLGGGIVVQLLLFFGVSVVLLIFTRPLAVRYMNKGVEKTNATDNSSNIADNGDVTFFYANPNKEP